MSISYKCKTKYKNHLKCLQSDFMLFFYCWEFSGELEYDSEMYANGSHGVCGNEVYVKDGNSSSGSGRYQIPHQIPQGPTSNSRSPQHSDRNGIRDSSQKYTTVSL